MTEYYLFRIMLAIFIYVSLYIYLNFAPLTESIDIFEYSPMISQLDAFPSFIKNRNGKTVLRMRVLPPISQSRMEVLLSQYPTKDVLEITKDRDLIWMSLCRKYAEFTRKGDEFKFLLKKYRVLQSEFVGNEDSPLYLVPARKLLQQMYQLNKKSKMVLKKITTLKQRLDIYQDSSSQ